jgi:hypothetical protein
MGPRGRIPDPSSRRITIPSFGKEMELGRILEVHATRPRYHTTEDGRWDYRITIVFKNAAIADDNFDASGIIKQLYPDQDTYKTAVSSGRSSNCLSGVWLREFVPWVALPKTAPVCDLLACFEGLELFW